LQTYTIDKSESIDLTRIEFPFFEVPKKVPLGTTCEITQPPLTSARKDSLSSRLLRWGRMVVYQGLVETKRAKFCHKAIAPKILPHGNFEDRLFVDVLKSREGDRASYGGLITCGSVWNCPVCASKISEKRRLELAQALAVAESKGFDVWHLTLTAPHHMGESLDDLLEKMVHARRLMLNRKPWKRLMTLVGLEGTIRALEVTHSYLNGWHVHFHVLLIVSKQDQDDKLKEIEEMMFQAWADACESVGLERPSRDHGLKLQDGKAAGEYVGKWGFEHEITKAHIKEGRDGNLSPFQFLDKVVEGDNRYKGLFLEYVKSFKGRKQLVWSKGLRGLLEMEEEISDEEIAEGIDSDFYLFAQIPREIWYQVILPMEKRAEVIEQCRYGEERFKEYVESLIERSGKEIKGKVCLIGENYGKHG